MRLRRLADPPSFAKHGASAGSLVSAGEGVKNKIPPLLTKERG